MVNTTYLVTFISDDLTSESTDALVSSLAVASQGLGADVRVGKVSDEGTRRAIVAAISKAKAARRKSGKPGIEDRDTEALMDTETKLKAVYDLLQEINNELPVNRAGWSSVQSALESVGHALEVYEK